MTPAEFKAWFEGFAEGIEGRPTEAQWERIKARVADLDARAASAIEKGISVSDYLDEKMRLKGPVIYTT